jgi:Zn-dependent M28 family amino/carboxypeptidase
MAGEVAENLRRHVFELAGKIGERNYLKMPYLHLARDYIEAQLADTGLAVEKRPYRVQGMEFENVVGTLPGRSAETLVVGAHYDTVPGSPGADDNASGVAALLELARMFGRKPGNRTVRFVGFVNEEMPFFLSPDRGSRIYAKECRQAGDLISGMISLEMVGYFRDEPGSQRYPFPLNFFYPSTGNFIGVVGNFRSRALVRSLVGGFRRAGKFPVESVAAFKGITGVGLSDHASFWEQGWPAAMITDTSFFRTPNYHTGSDTPDTLDYPRMAHVVEGLAEWLREAIGYSSTG